MFESLFTTTGSTTSAIELVPLGISVMVAIICGLILGFAYGYKSRTTSSLMLALALLPAIVCVVIAMVNGNVGAGVAVAGAFSLVRFRSVPGSARDISYIFMAMGIGLVCGMGYVVYALIFTLVLAGLGLALQATGFGEKRSQRDRTLRVTVPEDLDYTGLLSDVFARYTSYHDLVSVKTANMGSLYRLTYDIGLIKSENERALIDEIRTRNGNLEVSLSYQSSESFEL